MKHFALKINLLAIVSATLLAACAGISTSKSGYWKTGSTLAEVSSASTSCEVVALRQVPRAMAVGQTPTYTTPTYSNPSYTNCYGSGYGATCYTTGGGVSGGQTYGGQTYTYDANAKLRERVELQCMASRGFQYVTVPNCTPEQIASGTVRSPNLPLPNLAQVVCSSPEGFVVM